MSALPNWFFALRLEMPATARNRDHFARAQTVPRAREEQAAQQREALLARVLSGLKSFIDDPVEWAEASPVQQDQVELAARVLSRFLRVGTPLPFLVPTISGGIQMEWHLRGIDLEIETLSSDTLTVCFSDTSTGSEWEKDIASDWTAIGTAINEVTRRASISGK